MKLADTNVLMHAVNRAAPQHATARDWLAAALVDPGGVGLAWNSLIGFIRLSTRPGIMKPALSTEEALAPVQRWLAAPAVTVLHPGEQHLPLLARLLIGAGTAGNLSNDAQLAALAIEHGATLVSFDRDFARFAGLSFELLV